MSLLLQHIVENFLSILYFLDEKIREAERVREKYRERERERENN